MCGIAGLWGGFGRDEGLDIVQRMTDAIRHRGPDSGGLWAADRFAFGMRRLSIIDLATGEQPIWAGGEPGQGTSIIFNGEIYNYRRLRTELEKQGHRFRTHSDTEVVLRLYEQEGVSCIDRLEGMFAICLYDPSRGQMHLVRDRLGKKPLYYMESENRFLFASEIKAILAVLPARPALDMQSIHHYLTLRYVCGPSTIWQGIRKLDPGCRLTLDLATGATEIQQYWKLDFHAEALDPGRDYLAEFETLFLDAVDKRLLASDVPVGILLSGGLDSSAVSAAAVALGHQKIRSFSVASSEGGEFSELPFARQVAEHLGLIHREVVINQDEFIAFLPEFVYFTDEPLADLASIPLHFVSRLAKEDVKVVLSGEGSDEILAGYDFERLARTLNRLRALDNPIARKTMKMLAPLAPGKWSRAAEKFSTGGWSKYLREIPAHMTRVWSDDHKTTLWGDETHFASTEALIRDWYDETSSRQPLDQIQQVYCKSWLVEDLLMKADKMTMAASLELRVPFLDHHLVEWASRLPMEWRVGDARNGYSSKRVLRAFAAKYLPASIVDRPKQGFPTPAYRWFTTGFASWASDRLTGPSSRLTQWFRPSAMQEGLNEARAGNTQAAHRIWSLIVLEEWLRVWT